jgi:protein-L-isoaspartate(D-aspartate) O-methyltransferase
MVDYKKFQDQIIASTRSFSKSHPLSQQVIDAYYAVPRHKFVKKYRYWKTLEWIEVTDQNLEENLAQLYSNNPIILHGTDEEFEDPDGKQISTLSQQSLVLFMVELLKLEKGHKVFELGAASGFNAGLMGHLVGPNGKVVSVEIISELIQNARKSIQELGLFQVEIIEGDGGEGYEKFAPYDRAVFTAGANDLPGAFYRQIKKGGLLLLVLRNKGGAATLILFRKMNDYFQSTYTTNCDFVPVTGKFDVQGLGYIPLEKILAGNKIKPKPVDRTPFYWGGADSDEHSFLWYTAGFRSFLSISEPTFVAIRLDKETTSFGLLDPKYKSLVVAKYNELVSYGSHKTRNRLLKILKGWTAKGMPGLVSLKVRAYPISRKIKAKKNQWLVKRNESQFLWSMPK